MNVGIYTSRLPSPNTPLSAYWSPSPRGNLIICPLESLLPPPPSLSLLPPVASGKFYVAWVQFFASNYKTNYIRLWMWCFHTAPGRHFKTTRRPPQDHLKQKLNFCSSKILHPKKPAFEFIVCFGIFFVGLWSLHNDELTCPVLNDSSVTAGHTLLTLVTIYCLWRAEECCDGSQAASAEQRLLPRQG